jgi:hypothetical protein
MHARIKLPIILILLFALFSISAQPVFAQQSSFEIRRQAPLPPITQTEPKFTPETSHNELELPQVTPEFVGRWGGHLYLLDSVNIKPEQSVPTSLAFGQRSDSTVFVKTGVWGNPNATVLRTEAKVISPLHVKITEQHLNHDGPQALRVSQEYDLLLKNGSMDCIETVRAFVYASEAPAIDDRPVVSAAYHGRLHILTDAQERAMAEEIVESGDVFQAGVEGSRSFAP